MKKRFFIIGIMGGGSGSPEVLKSAHRLGMLIASQGWVLLNGGRNTGVMDASARGAKEKGGLTVGILPDTDTRGASEFIDIPIATGMGHARNSINVLSSDIVVACPGGAGTMSEIALALKNSKPVVLLNHEHEKWFERYEKSGQLQHATTPEEVIEKILGTI